jgi:DMSO/TMAO reductase YedYZ molybdopterin-dependent catalytic subunit
MNWQQSIRSASAAALIGLATHFAAGYALGWPFLTDMLAEWIMARTPSHWAVPLMDAMGEWAKPFAATGGLAMLGFFLWVPQLLPFAGLRLAAALCLSGLPWYFGYTHFGGMLAFWVPALAFLYWPGSSWPRSVAKPVAVKASSRREALTGIVMASGTVAVAVEALLRNRALAARATSPVPLFPMRIPPGYEPWGDGLVRKPITPLKEFYVMSKNTVDPAPSPQDWRLRIQRDGVTLREFSYAELLSMKREERYVSLRCVSNSLKSNLMGTGYWSGIRLDQLVRRSEIPTNTVEMAVIGLDGHGDSFRLDYAFSGEPLFALGMNGDTLTRNHGFPIRMLSPRYYGFKSIKWIDRIDFVSQPYFGTWPQMGYTKEPVIHPGAYVDRVRQEKDRLLAGGIAYSGHGQVAEVRLRLLDAAKKPLGDWTTAELETPLSPQTFTRWKHGLAASPQAAFLEARIRDASGRWQAEQEKPLFPDGVAGPTIKTL